MDELLDLVDEEFEAKNTSERNTKVEPYEVELSSIENNVELMIEWENVTQKNVETNIFLASLGDTKIATTTHPDAIKYVKNFKGHKKELTSILYKLYNAKVFDGLLPSDTKLIWSNSLLTTAGKCSFKGKGMISKLLLCTKNIFFTCPYSCNTLVWLSFGSAFENGKI